MTKTEMDLSSWSLWQRKVSLSLMASIVTVSLLYSFGVLQSLPCGNDLGSTFVRNFIHVDTVHLLTNLWGLFSLTPLELQLGPGKFVGLVTMVLGFSTLLEWLVRQWTKLPCSIGISGLLYGLFTWNLLSRKKVDWFILSAILLQTVVQGLVDKRVSLSGHLLGALGGAMAVPLTRWLFKY